MKYQNTTTNFFLLATSVLFLLSLVAYYLYFNHIRNDGEVASSLQNEIDLLSEKTTRLDSIRSILADTATNRAKLSSAVVAADGVADFAGELEALSESFGTKIDINALEIKNLNPISGSLEILSVRFTVNGSWRQATRFFNALENLPYGLKFNQITLSKVSDAKSGSSWQALFTIEVLKRK